MTNNKAYFNIKFNALFATLNLKQLQIKTWEILTKPITSSVLSKKQNAIN